MTRRSVPVLTTLAVITLASAGIAAARGLDTSTQPEDPTVVLPQQREALKRLAPMDGTWRGTAWTILPTGERQEMIQTERVGTMLDGTIRVVEGRGDDPATGETLFNAFGVISYRPATRDYTMRSYAMGREGDFPIEPTADGFRWSMAMGPVEIRYVATITEDRWIERGERIVPGQAPFQFFEMDLQRVGTTDWPAASPVPMKADAPGG